ncbi:MAG TPA: hypothetical protein VNM48_16130 [Chloroflexota bacterium]|nr:hypothetical protein [Chloroflexota bacterium]
MAVTPRHGAPLVEPSEVANLDVLIDRVANAFDTSAALSAHAHAHADTTGKTANDHHAQAHALSGGDHTGALALSQLPTVPSCRVYNSAAQSIPNNAETAVTLDSERFDASGLHSTTVNTSRFAVPAGLGGIYEITGNAQISPSSAGTRRYGAIRLNGTTLLAVSEGIISATQPAWFTPTGIYSLAAGDYVELVVFQNSGGALNSVASPNTSPEFSMVRVG